MIQLMIKKDDLTEIIENLANLDNQVNNLDFLNESEELTSTGVNRIINSLDCINQILYVILKQANEFKVIYDAYKKNTEIK